jgi:ferredoxin
LKKTNNKLNNKNMNVEIDQSKCIGCGICAKTCPDGIEMIDNKAVIKNSNAKCLKEAVTVCPINIIKFNGDENIESSQSETTEDASTKPEKNTNTNFGRGQGGQGRGLGRNQGNGQKRGMGFGRGKGVGRGRR